MKKRALHAIILFVLVTLTLLSSLSSALGAPGDYLTKWGAQYKFINIAGVTVDSNGNVYVVDNAMIHVFDSMGVFQRKWGRDGNVYTRFTHLRGVAVDGKGNIYVSDPTNNKIQVFDGKGSLILEWGSYGSGDGQFWEPAGVAIDGSGNVYVADAGNGRIQVFDSSGTFLRKFGRDRLYNPNGVAIDVSGNIYVTDTYYRGPGIQIFNSTGVFLRAFGSPGYGDGQLYVPTGIAVDRNNNIYVSDNGNNRIQVFDSSGVLLRKWGTDNHLSGRIEDGQFHVPNGVALDGAGNVYVADSGNQRIQVFDKTGTFFRKWGFIGNGNGDLYSPNGVAVDEGDNVYVADTKNHRIQVFDNSGNFLRKWGNGGACDGQFWYDWCVSYNKSYPTGDGQFYGPTGVAVNESGNVYVSDYGIQVFDNSGTFRRKWGSYGTSVAVDGSGNVYAANTYSHNVLIFDSTGTYLRSLGGYGSGDGRFVYPYGVAVDGSGNIYVTDANHRVQVFDNTGIFIRKWGRYGQGDGQFYYPYGVAVDGSGNVYVADTYNNRIQVFDNVGNFLGKWGSVGTDNGQFNYPKGVAINRSGTKVYVADSGNNRIQVFEGYGSGSKDVDKPVTTAAAIGTKGNNDWYVSDVTVTLTATDTGSGVKEILYAVDGGAETTIAGSSTSIAVSADGTHTITYYAKDNAGNIESPNSITFKLDKTPPVITITGIENGATYSLGLVPTAAYTATDATSGLAASSSTLAGGDGLGLGTFTYTVTASDNAGNVATVPVVYQVIATPDGLLALINQMLASGLIDNEGIANSLIAKITNAQNAVNGQAGDNIMQAFINQVEAQAGQHIAQDAAAVLINAAKYIIGH